MDIKRWLLMIVGFTFVTGIGVGIGFLSAPGEHRQSTPTGNLRAGFIDEFITRNDGYPGLIEHYGLEFPLRPEPLGPGEVYQRLTERKVDVISGHTTAASVRGDTLVALKDDKNFFLPRYEAAPLVRRPILSDHPELKKLLGSLAGKISEKQMREMNYQVEKGGKSAEDVALKFLVSEKLLDAGQSSIYSSGGTITIGSKSFTESEILAELMAILIEVKSNLKVIRKLNLGTTANVFGLIRAGQIDLYAEYSGTGLNILGPIDREVIQNPNVAFEMVRREFGHDYDLVWLERFGFNNAWTLVMRRQDARGFGLKTISDLAALLKEQSELDAPVLHAGTTARVDVVKTTPKQILRDLKERLQPALEGGRMSKTRDARLRAQIDLVSLQIKLGSMLKDLNSRLVKVVEVAKKSREEITKDAAERLFSRLAEGKKVASKARKIAEPFRVKIGETERALIEQIQFIEKDAGAVIPNGTRQWLADSENLLQRVEVLAVSSWDTVRNEFDRHLEVVEELRKPKVQPKPLKALRDEAGKMHKEIINLERYFVTAARQRVQLKRQVYLATDQVEAAEACLKSGSMQISSVKSGSSVDEFKPEAEAECNEKRAVVLGRGAELMEALLGRKRKEKNDLEWDLDFEHRQLEELKNVKAADKIIKAAGKRVDARQSALESIQKDLAPLDGLVKKVQLKMRLARLKAKSVPKVAVHAGVLLDGVKTGLGNTTILPWVIGSIMALMTMGGAMAIRYGVWEKIISTVKKMKGSRENKGAEDPLDDMEIADPPKKKR